MRLLKLLLPFQIALLLTAPASYAEESCLKRVFNHYCLGSDIRDLAQRSSGFIHQQREGERFALIYPAGREKDYVMAYRNRIYKVLRKYEPSTNIRYRDLRELLSEKYGAPVDKSQLPLYAKGLGAKIGAIRRGEGRMMLYWYPEGKLWHIELGWSREMGLNLAYLDTAAKARQQVEETTTY